MSKEEQVRIHGSATLGDVNCESFKISGSTKVNGTLKAENADISGSTNIKEEISVGMLSISGNFEVNGKTQANEITVSGSAKFRDKVNVKELLKISGSTTFEDSVEAKEIRSSGSLRSRKDMKAEKIRFTGAFTIDDLLKADDIYLTIKNKSKVKHIEGDSITVERSKEGTTSSSNTFLDVETIKGKTIALEVTKADLVEGGTVKIGPKCQINKVKGKQLDIHEDAQVKHKEQL